MTKRLMLIALGTIFLAGTWVSAAEDPTERQSRRDAFYEAIKDNPEWLKERPVVNESAPRAVFTVTTTADAGPGSLRAAILAANANGVNDIINFNIMPLDGTVKTINLLTPLPWLTDPAGVMIDGLTQDIANVGASPPASLQLLVELNATMVGPGGHGVLVLNGSFNIVQGLIVNNHRESGIAIIGGAFETPSRTLYNGT